MLTRYWSPSASLQIKGLATKYTTVKWPITTHTLDALPLSYRGLVADLAV